MLASLRSPGVFPARGPVLVDPIGVPRYWAAVWVSFLAADLANSTIIHKLNHIQAFYRHADEALGPGKLDDALADFNLDALCSALEGFFFAIRNKPPVTAASEERWQAALQFVLETVRRFSRGSHPLDEIASRLAEFELLHSHLHVGRRRHPERIRSLPADVVNALYDMLDPESPHNPFRKGRTRWLVYTTFVLLLHQGLRRGELLSLPVDAIKSGIDQETEKLRYWMTIRYNEYEDEDEDPRYTKPSIKNAPSIRQIPVTHVTARIVEEYVINYRGKVEHSFLLNSQKRRPLSHESITKAFNKISDSLPNTLRSTLRDHTGSVTITAHDLRHTCAVIRLNQFLAQFPDMSDALKRLRVFFGWSRNSDMPERYARAVFEDRLCSIWNDGFDERVELLRNLPARSI